MTVANGNMSTYPSSLKGHIENGSPLSCSASGLVLLLGPAWGPVARPYGFVPAQLECPVVEGGPFGSDRYV